MTSLTKNLHPPTKKFFFQCKLQALPRLLAGSVALTGPEKFPRKATCVSVFLFSKISDFGRTPKCNFETNDRNFSVTKMSQQEIDRNVSAKKNQGERHAYGCWASEIHSKLSKNAPVDFFY